MFQNGYDVPSLSSGICSINFLKRGREGYYFIPKYSQTANASKCFSYPHKSILIDKLDALVQTWPRSDSLEAAKQAKAVKRTVELMKVHSPDIAWLIRWLGVINPNDEIFKKSYKFVRPRPELSESEDEAFLNNDDEFFKDLPPLDDKTIRKTNRLRIPKSL